MSLLLDALKKAAAEKNKSSSVAHTGDKQATNKTLTTENKKTAIRSETKTLTEAEKLNASLTLDDYTLAPLDESAEKIASKKENTNSLDAAKNDRSLYQAPPEQRTEKNRHYTITDDGLSMLIYKTNRQIKSTRLKLIAIIATLSISILAVIGFYHYQENKIEIANIERKHKITMQKIQFKTQNEDNSEIQNEKRVNEDNIDNVFETKSGYKNNKINHRKAPPKKNKKKFNEPLIIKKVINEDNIGVLLENAWQAYNNKNYQQSKKTYQQVIKQEKNNRDAQLGLAAIAIQEKKLAQAKVIYQKILKQNPNDSIAIVSLATLNKEATPKNKEEMLLTRLQKNTDDATLHFTLGKIYSAQNKWRLAQHYFFNAWQHQENNANYIFNLAVSLDHLNKLNQARDFYQKSLAALNGQQISFSKQAVQKRINELDGLKK